MKTIGICAPSLSPGRKAMFEALGEALGVSFELRTFSDRDCVDGWIVLDADQTVASYINRSTRPCYVVPAQSELSSCGASSQVTFVNHPDQDEVLRGRVITADDATEAKGLPAWLLDRNALALKDGAAWWAVQQRGALRHHYVGLEPPELNDSDPLFVHLSGPRLVRLLPLVLFVRSLAEESGWQRPPLQAAFMFDDPNLHWTSYGFIDYSEMVSRAAGNYHVAMATIPLDGWYVHSPAGAIFNKNRSAISLLFHGNDHVSNELARKQSADATQRMLRQAVGRIVRMEARTGLEVARVMAPPHGACSEKTIGEMARLGFEALCVSRGSLHYHNRQALWTRTIGMAPCDVISGLPIIPRFGLENDCQNDVLIAALLRQPIVPMTHHQAVADGYGLLDETASLVNSLGDVAWRDLKAISRAMYSQRVDGDVLRVRMMTKRITVPVPSGASRIQVERRWLEHGTEEPLFWRMTDHDRRWNNGSHEPLAAKAGMTVEFASGAAGPARTETEAAGSHRLTPVARRVLTEVRDRALPSFHRIARRG